MVVNSAMELSFLYANKMGSQAFHPVTHISFGLRLDYIPVSRLMVNAPVSSGDSTPFGNTGAPVPTGAFLLIAAVVLLLAPLEVRSEEHTSELQSRFDLVCRLLLE